MHPTTLLAVLLLFLPLLGSAIPLLSIEKHSPAELITKRQESSTPTLYYPSGESQDTCPAAGGNPYDTLQPGSKRKRSASDVLSDAISSLILRTAPEKSPALTRRNLCSQVASGSCSHYNNHIGNTQTVRLLLGATYVFSWAFDEVIESIQAFVSNPDGTFSMIQSQGFNQGSGTMTLAPGANDRDVHFRVEFSQFNAVYDVFDISGMFALFQTANGDVNP